MKTVFDILNDKQLAIMITVALVTLGMLIWAFVIVIKKPKKTVWTVPPAADIRLARDWEANDERENEL